MRRGRLKWFEGGQEEATADEDEDGDEESGKI